MNTITCPHCHKSFSIDESDYQELLNHIRTEVFKQEVEAEIARREETARLRQEAAEAQAKAEHEKQLGELQAKLKEALARIEGQENETALKLAKQQEEMRKEMERIRQELSEAQAKVKEAGSAQEIALLKLKQQEEQRINELTAKLQRQETEAELTLVSLKQQHAAEIKMMQEQVDQYKNFKRTLSTKMIGESLEQYCYNRFNEIRPNMPANITFEKDNEVAEGTKGDFIYREYDENGNIILSIMFEMKNEADTTATKHRNEDFFAKLDSDRTKKGCEYAVLVSTLEPENDFYNAGIVDVSFRYEKMFVVRPQCFIPIISILRAAARSRDEYRRKLIEEQQKNLDVTHFEEKLATFQERMGKNIETAAKKFDAAIANLDKAIDQLTKMRESLVSSRDHLVKAGKIGEEITVRKLTHGNPTMKQLIEEAREKNENTIDVEEEDEE